jgi:hypothetical protein
MNELKNMKALRYLLIVMAVLSVVSVQAATLGAPYQPQTRGIRYTSYHSQMPTVAMNSTAASKMMSSGSSLPMAAVSGVYVTGATPESSSPVTKHPGHVRREDGNGDGWEDEEEPDKPGEMFPLGDVLWPLMLMAVGYVIYCIRRRDMKARMNE